MSSLKFISPTALIIIAGTADICKEKGVELCLKHGSMNSPAMKFLAESGFIEVRIPESDAEFIPYKQWSKDEIFDELILDSYVTDILRKSHVDMDNTVFSKLYTNIVEMISNAGYHSEQEKGFYSCGVYLPEKEVMHFGIYDTGIGIINSVNRFLKDPSLTEEDLLKWALGKGNTTVTDIDYPRGLGFSFLQNFTVINKGYLRIVTNNVYCRVDEKGMKIEVLDKPIIGTSINLQINADFEYKYIIGGNNGNNS
jgi:hypothetical protein